MAKYIGENALAELVSKIKGDLATKQNTLTAGDNITISGNTISASGTKNITGDVRVSSLDAGIYKWTANNNKIFYKASGDDYVNATFSGEYILIVSLIDEQTSYKDWFILNDTLINCFFGSTGTGVYSKLSTNFRTKITNNYKIYATNNSGADASLDYGTSASSNYIVQRDDYGRISVPITPSSNTDATSKKYVDDGLGTKQDTLTFDTAPTSESTNPVTSGGVYTALNDKVDKVAGKGLSTDDFVSSDYYTKTQIDGLVSSVYKPAGSVAFANLPTLSSSVLGNVYNVTDAFTTTSNFVEGAGKSYPAGTNVVVVDIGSSTFKFDVLAGMVDLSGYVPTTRKINNKALSSDITLSASDVGALPSNTSYVSSVNGSSGAITGIQTTSNLVTSFSSTTSDSKYPSEKLVKTSLDAKQDTMTELTSTEVDDIWEGN